MLEHLELPAPCRGDRALIETWLHGRPQETQRAYLLAAVNFLGNIRKPLREVTIADVQRYRDLLEALGLAPTSVRARCAALKSLLTFGHDAGALPANVGTALRLPAAGNTLFDRILSEADVLRLIARVTRDRDRVLCLTIYAAALRASEAARLRKRDVAAHGSGGVLNVWGKGSRPRTVRVSASTFAELVKIAPEGDGETLIFGVGSRQIGRIAKRAAIAAGLPANVSPHWLRHAHASHALDRGCPISLVQQTLGHKSVQTTGTYLHARPTDSSALYLPV